MWNNRNSYKSSQQLLVNLDVSLEYIVNIFDSMRGKDQLTRAIEGTNNITGLYSTKASHSEVYACVFKGKKVLLTVVCLHSVAFATTLCGVSNIYGIQLRKYEKAFARLLCEW